jgi:hypothetical protein
MHELFHGTNANAAALPNQPIAKFPALQQINTLAKAA